MDRSNSGENNVLVRRVKNRDGSEIADDANNVDGRECEEEIEDCDSKETRLTLMEEVLLLGLKDKEVSRKILILCIFFFLEINSLRNLFRGLLLLFVTSWRTG
jgi:hypothetical protein